MARAISYSPRSLSTFKIIATLRTTGRSRALACPKNTPCASLWKDQDRFKNRDFYYSDRILVGTRYFQTNTGRIPTRSGWLDTSFCRLVTWICVNIFSYFTGQLHAGHVSCATYQHVIQSNQKQSFGTGTPSILMSRLLSASWLHFCQQFWTLPCRGLCRKAWYEDRISSRLILTCSHFENVLWKFLHETRKIRNRLISFLEGNSYGFPKARIVLKKSHDMFAWRSL